MSQTDPSSGQELEAVAARVEAGLARAAFYVLTPWLAMHLICGFIWSRPLAWQGAMAALMALTWWSRRWTASRGLAWGAALLAVFGALHVVELVAELKAPPLAYSAARAGRPIDFRGYFEVFDDEKAAGRVAVPAIMPGGAFQMNHRDFSLDGRGVTPLSGFSNVRTILCAESGTWEFYDSDQHGFNNPPGVWDLPTQVGVVGDSFTQATCVKANENIPALIRQRYPGTVNLGMGGNGPMLELGGIKEFLAPRKPRVVLQLYYENDVGNLVEEWSNPNLRAYLTDRNYRVNLLDNQGAVDAWLRGVLAAEDGRAKRWPARLV